MKKNKTYLVYVFMMFIICLPVVVELINSVINGTYLPIICRRYITKLLIILRNYMSSYYATVLSLAFTIYVFVKKQEQRDEEHFKNEKEKSEKSLQIQQESNRIKLQEIENGRDKYRPTFIIKNNRIQLLMRNNDLFLENIVFFTDLCTGYDVGTKKSGEIISYGTEDNPIPDSFYIIANTILGEKIIFGCIFGENKIYKFLREDANPLYPKGSKISDFKIENINEHWKSYNNFNDNWNQEIEEFFFYNSQGIRERFVYDHNQSIHNVLKSSNYQELFNCLFSNLLNKNEQYTIESVINIIMCVYNHIVLYDSHISFELDTSKMDINYLYNTVEKRLAVLIPKYKSLFTEDAVLDVIKIYKHVIVILELPKKSESNDHILGQVLRILAETFENVYVVSDLEEKFLFLKMEVLKIIRFKDKN